MDLSFENNPRCAVALKSASTDYDRAKALQVHMGTAITDRSSIFWESEKFYSWKGIEGLFRLQEMTCARQDNHLPQAATIILSQTRMPAQTKVKANSGNTHSSSCERMYNNVWLAWLKNPHESSTHPVLKEHTWIRNWPVRLRKPSHSFRET